MHVPAVPALEPEAALPMDEGLPGLPRLFDREWVWRAFCARSGAPEDPPQRILARQLLYQPGARAVIDYVAEWRWDRWVMEDQFAVELAAGKQARLFRYPDDPYLPGLRQAGSAPEAHELLSRHLPLHPSYLRVETVRYRPGTRAVLRYTARWRQVRGGKVTLFARVLPPARVPRLLAAAVLAERSGFALPRFAGCWPEGGVVWVAGVPGKTVRTLIRKGEPPDPDLLLDGLARLWSSPAAPSVGRALDLAAHFRHTRRLLSQVLEDEAARRVLHRVVDILGPFAERWRPSAPAHNDFYDDQLLLTPAGRLVLVDFEEAGPGDPLLDVGNLLAHLRWTARFGVAPEACDVYRQCFRSVALDRFGWEGRELALREAFALFRLSTNPVRQLHRHWPRAVETGLSLVCEALEDAC